MASEQEPFAARDERTNAYHTYNAAGNGVQCPDRGNAPPTARSGDLQRRMGDRIKAWVERKRKPRNGHGMQASAEGAARDQVRHHPCRAYLLAPSALVRS